MKYLDESGLSYLLSKLKDMYALKGEASGSSWYTGAELSGEGDATVSPSIEIRLERTMHSTTVADSISSAEITLTAQRDLDNVTISGQYYGNESYDNYTLTAGNNSILTWVNGKGENDFRQLWTGSLSSGQTIYLKHSLSTHFPHAREAETYFLVSYQGSAEDFTVATGSTNKTSWTATPTVAPSPYAVGDYYLNTEELTLYRCTEASDTGSSWEYLCTLGGSDVDLSGYATKEDLGDYIPTTERSSFATKSELSGYIPTSKESSFATKNDLKGYIPTSERSSFATKNDLSSYIPTSERDNFATKEELDKYALKGEVGGSSWHTGAMLSGAQDGTGREYTEIHLERAQHYSEGVSLISAAISLTAQRDLDNVTISGQFYGGGNYDRYILLVAQASVLDETNGTGEKEFCELWSGSIASGQTIYLQHLISTSVNKREPETYFLVHYDGEPGGFKVTSTGSSDTTKWNADFKTEGDSVSVGDYYLNVEEHTLYRCTEVEGAESKWEYVCTFDAKDIDLSGYATKAELSDFVTRDELPKGGSTWYTGTMLSGKGDVTRQGTDIHLERAQHYSEGVSLTSAAITLTAQRDLESVTISGQFYGGGTYDRYNLKVAGADILDATSGTGEKEFSELWSGSLSSGQTIYLQHLIAVSTVNKREPETYFIVHYDGDPEDFKTSGGTSDRNKWTATFSEENEAYSIGDYYLNTKELTLYRCTQSSEAGSSWKYLCTLGGGG